MLLSPQEQRLCALLRDLPIEFNNRFTDTAKFRLIELLFRSLAHPGQDYFPLFFPAGTPPSSGKLWSLRAAQGAAEGAEYTEAARGHPCGHIFKSGEASYRCKTCTVDDTCVLCAKCFDASDHEGHLVYVSISPGNSGCCDCGDDEAWIKPVHCNIHTASTSSGSNSAGKAKEGSVLPQELLHSIRMTIARSLDYICDVFSCSPEQLRLVKTEESVRQDERLSRLSSKWYEGADPPEPDQEFALVLWNDEKHTVFDVRDQIARACKVKKSFGMDKAREVDDIGRSTVIFSSDLPELLKMAKIIEEIKLTVTVRSARDTFREQMCGTIIEWISDIAGCSVGADHHVLRTTVCEEMLKAWRMGSEAHHVQIGADGLDDHAAEDEIEEELRLASRIARRQIRVVRAEPATGRATAILLNPNDPQGEVGEDANPGDQDDVDEDEMDLDRMLQEPGNEMLEMDISDGFEPDDDLEQSEATLAGYPPPPPPPRNTGHQSLDQASGDSDDTELSRSAPVEAFMTVPQTPRLIARSKSRTQAPPKPPRYWLDKPDGYNTNVDVPIHENLWQRVRLDFMILYDLRMWKKIRIDMRDLFISTVVTLPAFKRLLGLRFAGLYTALAQLYLIADREPDHSIINLSLQMLTTPSITAEIVERGNFLTNLMAILYTFLTTRQVGYPSNVNLGATLAFEAGAVANRRMYHFFMDMKYLLGSDLVQERIRDEDQYLLQFLDLVKLHQGICPNLRAVGEHLEYETDTWISASIITREMNKLCRQFSEAFSFKLDPVSLSRAIRSTAKVAIINSLGAERERFDSEIKESINFKSLEPFEFDGDSTLTVVDFVVEKEYMSFHHALHYTLSWLIDRAKSLSREELQRLLLFSTWDLKQAPVPPKAEIPGHTPTEHLLALFDFPLRVCAWLSQMRAGMWVRNGITLRHQMSTYRGVTQRDVSYQRDIFLLQVAMVVCHPMNVLASIIDRFGMSNWVRGNFSIQTEWDEHQFIDVAEDFVHLLIVILSDRVPLLSPEDEPAWHVVAMRRDIAHILCFKPLSYSELTSRLADKVQDSDEFTELLSEMATFKPPEGLSDSGTFELKEQFIEEIDPYISWYNRNQREEAENIYKKFVSKSTGKPLADVVFEPKLRPVHSGAFQSIASFIKTPLFTQIVYYLLHYCVVACKEAPNIPSTRVEAFLHFVLQLTLLAVVEDKAGEDDMMDVSEESFVQMAISKRALHGSPGLPTILSLLHKLSNVDAFASCEPKIRLIVRRMHQSRPSEFASALAVQNISMDRVDTASPAPSSALDKEAKKKAALERTARVMAQMKEQQNSFLEQQAFDWGEEYLSDMEDDELESASGLSDSVWKYPAGTCILCQEETNDEKLYGTFSLIQESGILRQTPLTDTGGWLGEVNTCPDNLDKSAEAIRPFGVSGKNHRKVQKVTSDGTIILQDRQDLGKGFSPSSTRRGPVATGCGHIMHFSCFEVYITATQRRHNNQVARNHPEHLELKEFLCPLCKALGNSFLPIVWKGKPIEYPGVLQPDSIFDSWLTSQIHLQVAKLDKGPERTSPVNRLNHRDKIFVEYGLQEIITPLSQKFSELSILPHSRAVMHTGPPLFVSLQADEIPSGDSMAHSLPSMPVLELLRIYLRLRDSMKLNTLRTRHTYANTPAVLGEDLTYTDTLASSLGYSISAVEIAQRGVESEFNVLDKISTQTLTHLRILSETVSSYLAVGCLRNQSNNKCNEEFWDTQKRQLHQLFTGHTKFQPSNPQKEPPPPVLTLDPFIFFTECTSFMVPAMGIDVHHILRLCYLLEMVRVVLNFGSTRDGGIDLDPAQNNSDEMNNPGSAPLYFSSVEEMNNFSAFYEGVTALQTAVASPVPPVSKKNEIRFLHSLTRHYALPFLRKAFILMHVRYGVEYPQTVTDDQPELNRLSNLLNLPTLNEMFASVVDVSATGAALRHIIAGWVDHWRTIYQLTRPGSATILTPMPPRISFNLSLSHPAIFELVGLPKNYDSLTDEAIKRKCPTTGKDLTDPCVCLMCGEIFCSQAVCCTRDGNKGGCWQHQAKCGGNIGLFINIRKCMVLFMNLSNGTWATAPYLDKHGEADPTLRRHHQLFLNQRRYDVLLRSVWLSHGIPSAIARRLEGDVNNGGWETL
ncbi:RING finger domain-containing protein [Aulographum hederae CBS 113979]|uniref:E3 ubiquitin-protein ligase n=1 Tax=Aulographum hederae CBS 113979 TaxID=1176131 RepID=A0A6G1GXU9_9PEZI|nr:RING finger domain-containing protein [Aulographum hederae CBS 113979]